MWEELEMVVEELRWLACLESAEEIEGIPGRQITGAPATLFKLMPHQGE